MKIIALVSLLSAVLLGCREWQRKEDTLNRRNQPVTASGKADDNLVSVGTVEEKDAVRASAALSRERIKVVQVSGLGSVGLLVSANEEQRARTILGREAKAHGIKILPSDH